MRDKTDKGSVLKRGEIETSIKEAFNEVFRCYASQGDTWSVKQLEFIKILSDRLVGKKVKLFNTSFIETIRTGKVVCTLCGKKCKSQSGLTRHMRISKKHNA